MSVQTEIDRISTAVQNAHLKVIEKGGTSAAPYLVANLPDAIDTIPEAPTLDELTNPGSADTMLEGTEMLDAEGKKVTGAIPNKTADDLTANGAKVSVPAGYYAEDTEKSVSTAFLAKPSINVGADGLITASYKQWGGYVQSGTQETTRQLPTQDTMTVTPGKSGQVAVKAGKYTTGDVYVAGDSDLIPDNIKSGVSIFGVAGTMTAGEDVTAETETYTSLLDDLEAAVDALPDAGSGGSGGTVQMCTVTIKAKFAITATGYVDYLTATGYASEALPTASNSIQIQCLANSILTLGGNGFAAFTVSDGAELIRTVGSNSAMHTCIVYVTGDSTLQYGGA